MRGRNAARSCRPAVLLGLLLLALGCDAGSVQEEQEQFRLAALSEPSGITETDSDGALISEDPDDWRTAPLYRSRFFFAFAPYPNPAGAAESVQFAASFTGGAAGLVPYRINARGDLVRIQGVVGTTDGSAPLFSFPAGQLGEPRLHRVVLLDATGQIVTYGDVRLVP